MGILLRHKGAFLIGVLVGTALSLAVPVAMTDRMPGTIPKPVIERQQNTPLHLESDLRFT